MTGEFSLPVRVYIEDTDAGGIVYYVNYLKYFERARTEFMRTLGYDKAALLDDDLMFVVTGVSVDYKQSARLDDCLQVTASIVSAGAAKVVFNQSVRRDDDAVLAEGTVTIATVAREEGVARRMPAEMRRTLNRAVSVGDSD
ncbi:tol-pal system-associated acyl-CoA thioesterase [Luminiphilus syltensis NOR5-1B]|uniref:Tol-pal system-associated acyl-CoA thioesterase n=1 Tax=Luminiphilus syltensis NOR5-1B TaxID=565045 RepID=B8KS64_9GAMM|nr:tol-pal system-associated acyl-CoA thioesterase [Luminiphilus syltensis]EED34501.1 tol-pal system-associated acyl-CoA thioesterase [Luminiphilus syltensis NOR5-1B]